MEIINALLIAQKNNPEWAILETRSGGWQLQLMTEAASGTISYLKNPCPMNKGEAGKPYQVNCKQIKNFSSLYRALKFVQEQNR